MRSETSECLRKVVPAALTATHHVANKTDELAKRSNRTVNHLLSTEPMLNNEPSISGLTGIMLFKRRCEAAGATTNMR